MAVSAAEEGKQSKQTEQEGDHRAGIFSESTPPDQSLGAGRSFGEGQDVALVVVNRTGAWVKDASPAELTAVVQPLYRSGRGVYGMKALGSGQVTEPRAVASALLYAFDYPYAHAICVGITSEAELEADVAVWRARRSAKR